MGIFDDERIEAASDLRAAQMAHALLHPLPDVDGWHRGDWMQTFTGRRFYPLSPLADDVDPIDIAHALSMLCRYNGHVDRFYSVAEHCVLMSQYLEEWAIAQEWSADAIKQLALEALLHDGSEAYCGDMVRPLKHTEPMTPYRRAEDRITTAIRARFSLPINAVVAELVKDADTRILLTERTALMPNYKPSDRWSMDGMQALPVAIEAWDPATAELAYTTRLEDLRRLRLPTPDPTLCPCGKHRLDGDSYAMSHADWERFTAWLAAEQAKS